MLNVSQEYIDIQASTQIKEVNRRLISYRGSMEYDNEFKDNIIVLVDHGIATGAATYILYPYVDCILFLAKSNQNEMNQFILANTDDLSYRSR